MIRRFLAWLDARRVKRLETILALLAEHGELPGFKIGNLSGRGAQVYVDLMRLEDRGLIASRQEPSGRRFYRLAS